MKFLFLISIGFNLAFLAGCVKDFTQKVEADLWYIHSEDGSLRRTLKNGKQQHFLCTDGDYTKKKPDGANEYVCMHESNLQRWQDTLYKECK